MFLCLFFKYYTREKPGERKIIIITIIRKTCYTLTFGRKRILYTEGFFFLIIIKINICKHAFVFGETTAKFSYLERKILTFKTS